MERTKRSPTNSSAMMRSTSDSLLKRTQSSVNVAVAKSDLYLKDVKNFGSIDDHHLMPFNENETKVSVSKCFILQILNCHV